MKGRNFMKRSRCCAWLVCTLLAGLTVCCGWAGADEIVVLGSRYRDVLVMKSSTTYYVQIPWEGRTISVRAEEVDGSTVSISDDPYYRDKLRQEYRDSKDLRATGELPPRAPSKSDPRFQVQEQSKTKDFELYQEGPGGGAGGVGGLGVARTTVEQQLAGFGMQFSPGQARGGQPTVIANMGPAAQIVLIGPPGVLMGVSSSSTVPAAQVQAAAGQMQLMMGQLSPELAPQIGEIIKEAREKGEAKRNLDGVAITISFKPVGEMVEIKALVMASN